MKSIPQIRCVVGIAAVTMAAAAPSAQATARIRKPATTRQIAFAPEARGVAHAREAGSLIATAFLVAPGVSFPDHVDQSFTPWRQSGPATQGDQQRDSLGTVGDFRAGRRLPCSFLARRRGCRRPSRCARGACPISLRWRGGGCASRGNRGAGQDCRGTRRRSRSSARVAATARWFPCRTGTRGPWPPNGQRA